MEERKEKVWQKNGENTMQRIRVPIKDKSKIHLHRNMRPDKYNPSFFKTLNLKLEEMNAYHDLTILEKKLAEEFCCSAKNILLTNGVDGAIKSAFESLLGDRKSIGYLYPTYAMYEVYSNAFGVTTHCIIPTPNLVYKKEDVIRILPECGIIFLPNPSEPIESVFFEDEITEIALEAKKHNTYVFIDEVYYGFGAPTMDRMPFIFDNMIVARSFSKAYGLPGIRVGYLIGDSKIIEKLSEKRNAYEVSNLSMNVILWALENKKVFNDYMKEVITNRSWLRTKLEKLGVKTHGKYSNSILIKVDNREEITNKLYNAGFIVKTDIPFPADNYISVTIGNQKTVNDFFKAFKECL